MFLFFTIYKFGIVDNCELVQAPSEILRTARKRLNQTLKEVSDASGISLTTINAWERGASFPRGKNCRKICKYYGISERELTDAFVQGLQGSPSQVGIGDIDETRIIRMPTATWSIAETLMANLQKENLHMLFRDLLIEKKAQMPKKTEGN